MYEFQGFAQQGWQCPICKRVYSPTTPMCWYCGNGEVETTNSLEFVIKGSEEETDDEY